MKKVILLAAGLSILATGLMAGKCEFNSPVLTQPKKEEPKQTETPAPAPETPK